MKIKRLAPEVFDRVAAGTRLRKQARDMARAVLVDGRAHSDVATEYGMTRQRVSLAVGTVERAYPKFPERGRSSIRVELELPEALALELAALGKALIASTNVELAAEVTDQVLTAVRCGHKLLA